MSANILKNANQAARDDIAKRKAQSQQVSYEDRILNVNRSDLNDQLQKFMNMGEQTGYILGNTGNNIVIVASSPNELADVVAHWTSYDYRGGYDPSPYLHDPFIPEGDPRLEDHYEYTDSDWDAMHSKALENAKLVELSSLLTQHTAKRKAQSLPVEPGIYEYLNEEDYWWRLVVGNDGKAYIDTMDGLQASNFGDDLSLIDQMFENQANFGTNEIGADEFLEKARQLNLPFVDFQV